MSYRIELSQTLKLALSDIWALPSSAEIIEITPFGDFFVKTEDQRYQFYNLTDGQIKDVTQDVLEHGLPPVDFALGDEWYQLSAQQMLSEENWELKDSQCFGFKKPVFCGGDYGPDNLETIDISEYNRRIHALIDKQAT